MATTSLSLGEHWETFIRKEIATGRYGSASEVVRDALRTLEERKSKLDALRVHLAEGARQAGKGEFVSGFYFFSHTPPKFSHSILFYFNFCSIACAVGPLSVHKVNCWS